MLLAQLWASGLFAQENTLEQLVGQVGIAPADFSFNSEQLGLMVGNERMLAFNKLLLTSPLRANQLIAPVALKLMSLSPSKHDNLYSLISALSRLVDNATYRKLTSDPMGKIIKDSADDKKIHSLLSSLGLGDRTVDILSLPSQLKRAIYVMLVTELSAKKWIEKAKASLGPAAVTRLRAEVSKAAFSESLAADEIEQDSGLKQSLEWFDMSGLIVVAEDLALATEWSVQQLRTLKLSEIPAGLLINFRTSLGQVVITGVEDNLFDYRESPALIIDLGGNDTYFRAAEGIFSTAVSIDMNGDDRYEASQDAAVSFGAGLMGVGILWDDVGNDSYRGGDISEGAAKFGVGILVDWSGNDSYLSNLSSQAAAIAGIGILLDGAGNDRYFSYSYGQASAGPRSAALLLDLTGDDIYHLNDTDIRYPSSQDKAHNLSMGQGAGWGLRGDNLDGVSVAGGLGMLLDLNGQDRYLAGVFAQGVGYWSGGGILIDSAGSDTYTAHWYSQAAAAHHAVGILHDIAGDDSYSIGKRMGQGAGHDVSFALFLDEDGSDLYHSGDLSLGASSAAGRGIFLDKSGDDRYQCRSKTSIGYFSPVPNNDIRSAFGGYGLFFDYKGADRFDVDEVAATRLRSIGSHSLIVRNKLDAK